MDNTNINININDKNNIFNESTKKIKSMYDNLSYFDQYGNSIIGFFILSIVVFVIFSYFTVMADVQPIKDDWVNQRCNPRVIPFAGLINKPDDKTASEYTRENFNYCVEGILKTVTGVALAPINFVTSSLEKTFQGLNGDMNGVRGMVNNVRNSLKSVTQEIMGKLLNVVIPIQQIMIGFKDTMAKTQGVLTAGLFTALGGYMTLESSLGATVQLMNIILFGLLASILAFWAVPFTWGAAAALSVTFLSIAIPLAIIVAALNEMGIKAEGVPKLKCFDKNTMIKMNDGTFKPISQIDVREKLADGSIVTGIMRLDASEMDMYELDGTIVSGCHMVKNAKDIYNSWIPVREHPNRKKIAFYEEPYLYCMNTTSKELKINNTIYTDWDEIYHYSLERNFNKIRKFKKDDDSVEYDGKEIHRYLDGGFQEDTMILMKDGSEKKIKDIQVNDVLKKGGKVYGLVQIDGLDLENQFVYCLGKNQNFVGGPNLNFIDSNMFFENRTMYLDESYKLPIKNDTCKNERLYHLLTEKNVFRVGKILFNDYNSCVDL